VIVLRFGICVSFIILCTAKIPRMRCNFP